MRFVFKYLKPFRGAMIFGLFIKFCGTIMDLLLPYIFSHVIDDVIPLRENGLIYKWGVVMIVCSFIALTFNIMANRKAAAVARDTTRSIRNDLFKKISYLSNSQIDKWTIPSLISRMTTDTHYIHRTVGMMQRMGVRAPIIVTGGIVMTALLDPVLCIVLCCMLPIMAIIVFFVSKKGLPFFNKLQQSVDKLVRVIRENTTGVRVIKALSRVNAEKERFDDVNRQVMYDERKANTIMALTRPSTSFILNLGLVLVIVVGAYRVNLGLSKAGAIVAFLTYFTIILNSMIAVTRVITMTSQMLASSRRIEEVMNDVEAQPVAPFTGLVSSSAVEFRDVCFSYNKRKDNLHDISFTLEKGQSLGVIGPTGAGKSTLAALMLRFYDVDKGGIYIDGKNVNEYEHRELREKFGVVFQNDMLFDDTAEGNIRLWRNIDVKELETAIDTAQADFIKEEGLGKEIASRGANISGGQKQRLLIARAVAGKPDILILDDSSSALDYKTDSLVRSKIRERFADTTMVIIAQRVSSVRSCDKILVLENGKAQGFGSHEELMQNCELYAEIAKLQMGEGDESI